MSQRRSSRWLESQARVALRPFEELGASLEMMTRRDLLNPAEIEGDFRITDVVQDERRRLFGQNVGWETRREIVGRMTFQPRLTGWVRADLGVQTRYLGERDPGLVRFDEAVDSLPALLRNSGGQRDLSGSVTLDPAALIDELLGEGETGLWQAVGRAGRVVSPVTVSVQDGVRSRYYREAIDPDAGFQLGFGPAGSFGEIDEIIATTLADSRAISSGSGLQFPGSFFVNVNFQRARGRALDRRSDRRSESKTWPDIRTGVSVFPLPSAWRSRLPRISMSVGLQEVLQDVTFGGRFQQRRIRVDRRAPVELAFQWPSGVIARYRGLFGRGRGDDPTGVTERALVEHGVSLETRLIPTASLAAQIGGPVRVSFGLEYSENTECRVVTGRDTCVGFIDQINKSASVSLDTVLSGMEVGAQASIIDRRSFTGLRAGLTQF